MSDVSQGKDEDHVVHTGVGVDCVCNVCGSAHSCGCVVNRNNFAHVQPFEYYYSVKWEWVFDCVNIRVEDALKKNKCGRPRDITTSLFCFQHWKRESTTFAHVCIFCHAVLNVPHSLSLPITPLLCLPDLLVHVKEIQYARPYNARDRSIF